MMRTWSTFICVLFYGIAFSNTITTTSTCNLEIEDIIPMRCNESEEGKIEIVVSGGKPPYLYKINTNEFSESNIINSISSSNYDVTIKDSNGCEVTVYTYIEIPDPIEVSYEYEQGKLTINVNSIGDYKYRINNEEWGESSVFENITEVNSISVKTQYGCEISKIINEVNTTEVFKFHPNPARETVYIMGLHKIKTIDILNDFGTLVLSHQANKSVTKLNISDLKSGVYLIQVIDINDRRAIKKLIVN